MRRAPDHPLLGGATFRPPPFHSLSPRLGLSTVLGYPIVNSQGTPSHWRGANAASAGKRKESPLRMARRTLAFSLVAVAIAFIVLASGCQTSSTEGTSAKSRSGSKTAGPLVVYSGRKEKLFLPVVERFEKKTGIDVQLKQGATAELAATILEEQPNPRADIFLSQEAGFLDRLRREGSLLPYKPKNFDLVEEDFR